MDKLRAYLPCLAIVAVSVLALGLVISLASLKAEKTAHEVTRAAYARDKALWTANNAVANTSINALQGQVRAAQTQLDQYFKAEMSRQTMLKSAVTRARTPEEQNEVVDNETRRKAADLLNTF